MAQVGFALQLNQALPGGDYSTDRVPVPGDAIATQTALLALAVTAVQLVDTDVDLAVTSATTADTAAGTADTDVGTTVTDLVAAFTAYDIFGNALVAITGDSYSNTTHQWTTGGSTGLTHAQVVTLMGELNTAITDFITSQTANTAAKVATAAAKTDTAASTVAVTLVQTNSDLAVTAVNLPSLSGITAIASGDAMLIFDGTKVTTKNQARITGRRLVDQAANSASFT